MMTTGINARARLAAIAALTFAVADPAAAAVSDIAPGGFTASETAHIAAPADKIYSAIITPAKWWDSDHTFSRNAANLTLDARAGGCWCEALPDGGSVQHMTVVYASPGKILRLHGALGPLQSMPVSAIMTWTLKPSANGTDLTMTYAVGGYAKGGFAEMSEGVDGVLGEQLARLKSFIETGLPQPNPVNPR